MTKKAVCLLSGGLDSCVTSFIAKDEDYEIFTISFNYNQRHKKELLQAEKISTLLGSKKHVIIDLDLAKFGASSLTDLSIKPDLDKKIEDIGKEIPSTYVPARNTVFLSIALAYAESIDADAIFIGATATDYSGYPDCRPEYFDEFQKLVNLATKKGVSGEIIKIKTPLLNLSKTEIIKKGLDLNVPFDQTWSCYMGQDKACGKCESCLLRLKGFKEAGIIDPLGYEK